MARTETTDTAEKATRVRLSPAEKAAKTLGTAQKRYDKAVEKRAKYAADVTALDTEVAEAERFLDFAKGSRHLPENQTAGAVDGDVETFSPAS